MNEFTSFTGEGDFALYVNDKEVQRVSFTSDNYDAINFDISDYIKKNPRIFAAGKTVTFSV